MCGIWSYIKKSGTIDFLKLYEAFLNISGRGPETSTFSQIHKDIVLGFHRLAINGISPLGNQPFIHKISPFRYIYTICNGEIYNYHHLINTYDLTPYSSSDCEVIPLLYTRYGSNVSKYLDGEYAFVLFDINIDSHEFIVIASRDPFGVRPLFYGNNDNLLAFCSELKGLSDIVDKVIVFPPGNTLIYKNNELEFKVFYDYNKLYNLSNNIKPSDIEIYYKIIRDKFFESVEKRLMTERPLGCLLSGGLDSSMVAAVTSRILGKSIKTFTIGLEGATDIIYANKVADYIKSDHTTFIVKIEEALNAIDEVIRVIESYDCTSVRASVWQYLLGKKIKETQEIKVLLTGEGSDELASGYMYFHNAPSSQESHNENVRLLQDIHRYDGLRVDRAMSCHGLEVRIPFLDPQFVELYLSLDMKLRMANRDEKSMEKQLFRDSFNDMNLLPPYVLYRKKEAFSDGTSANEKSWFQIIQEHIDKIITDEEFEINKNKYEFNTPDTKEKYYYRKKFEEYYGDKSVDVIPYYWLPKWCGDVKDPSARVLEVYKK